MRLKIQCTTLFIYILSAAGRALRVTNPNRGLHGLHAVPEMNSTQAPYAESVMESSLSLTKDKYEFGESIQANFVNGSPRANSYPYFAIFHDKQGDVPLNEIPKWNTFLAWLNDCNSQNDCPSVLTEGSVEFSAADPKEAYYYTYTYDYYGYGYEYTLGYGYFPFRNGKYVVCYINDVYDVDATDDGAEAINQELITDCRRFQVKSPKKTMKKKAKVKPRPKNIKVGDSFFAKFKTPIPIPNQWIGVYPAENGKKPKGPLDGKALLWGYTACETQQGDQTETTNCDRKWEKGKVTLGKNHLNLENPDAVWPLPKGAYFMCLNFHANAPLNVFTCSKKITVT